MKIFIGDSNIIETLSLLKSIRQILMDAEGTRDFAPEILTINDFIDQIEYENKE